MVGKGRALQHLLRNVSLIHNNISSLWSACIAPLGHVIHFKIISVVFYTEVICKLSGLLAMFL